MAYMNQPYRDAVAIQKSLYSRITDRETGDKDCSLLARVWIEIEAFKREMRGVPRLLGHSLKEIDEYKRMMAKQLPHDAEGAATSYVELAEEPTPSTPTDPPA